MSSLATPAFRNRDCRKMFRFAPVLGWVRQVCSAGHVLGYSQDPMSLVPFSLGPALVPGGDG